MAKNMFKAAYIAMVPDADPEKHCCVLRTSIYELTSVLVKDEDQAVSVSKDLAKEEGVRSFLLCPGFTNEGVAKVARAVGKGVAVNVARGDGPSNAIAHRLMEEAGFFGPQ